MTGAMTSLSNRDVVALLKEWGFKEAGAKGGHQILELNGRRVQVTHPGRNTGTPYKALRKAANILGITLKDLLRGKPKPIKPVKPKVVPVKEETTVASTAAVIETPVAEETPEFICPVCQKTEFTTERGFKGHVRSHETVRCPQCGDTFSRQGLPSHKAHCRPAKRGRGRPRRPIAEAPERSVRERKIGVEVPEILDTFEDEEELPSPEVFERFVKAVKPDEDLLAFGQTDKISLLVETFFPGRTLTDEQTDEFLNWVEASKALFDTL